MLGKGETVGERGETLEEMGETLRGVPLKCETLGECAIWKSRVHRLRGVCHLECETLGECAV